jgi:MoaA/NifB/PqqE/SkfB family radical SAM enzyme
MLPNPAQPVVLNCDLTLQCNMRCVHCVARDMIKYTTSDLKTTSDLIKRINKSPFMVLVITGGEPFLPEYEKSLLRLIRGAKGKALIIDTNGTIFPSKTVLHEIIKKRVLVRVSCDSLRVKDEIALRRSPRGNEASKACYFQKIELIPKLRAAGVKISVQSVLHKVNEMSIRALPEKLNQWKIDTWYIQRLIPTSSIATLEKFSRNFDYDSAFDHLEKISARHGILCMTKRDRRHNCVFLMVGDGQIYTQAEQKGEKIFLGHLGQLAHYFELVSPTDHAARYYSSDRATTNKPKDKKVIYRRKPHGYGCKS